MKLFTVVRSDLEPGLQCAQSIHAAILFSHQFPEIEKLWYESSNNIVVLSIPDEAELLSLFKKAEREGYQAVAFTEPDLDGELTAITLEPVAYKLVANLPLALSQLSGKSCAPMDFVGSKSLA